jgi:hypothetical protein
MRMDAGLCRVPDMLSPWVSGMRECGNVGMWVCGYVGMWDWESMGNVGIKTPLYSVYKHLPRWRKYVLNPLLLYYNMY